MSFDDIDLWPRGVLAILATWRLTHLIVREDGPAGLLARARAALSDRLGAGMLDCFYCTSLWVAAPLALWVASRALDVAITWLALSGAACLCERIGQPDVVVQPLPESIPGEDDGMLRTQRDSAGDHDGVAATGR
jgi:hypothetical protein